MITSKTSHGKIMITIEGTDYVKSYILEVEKGGTFSFIPPTSKTTPTTSTTQTN